MWWFSKQAPNQEICGSLGTKEQLTKENDEWKQKSSSLEEQKTELEVRMNALKSQYEGRICRLERELREQQERHHEQRDEPPESSNKVWYLQRSLKSLAVKPSLVYFVCSCCSNLISLAFYLGYFQLSRMGVGQLPP